MDCGEIRISVHVPERFDERGFKATEIEVVIRDGEIIKEYSDDRPWPSYLVLGKVRDRSVHVVVARNPTDNVCVVITAYEPGGEERSPDLRTRKR